MCVYFFVAFDWHAVNFRWFLFFRKRKRKRMEQQPTILLLREGTDTSQGTPQLISNINAISAITDTVRTTLGPRGMCVSWQLEVDVKLE